MALGAVGVQPDVPNGIIITAIMSISKIQRAFPVPNGVHIQAEPLRESEQLCLKQDIKNVAKMHLTAVQAGLAVPITELLIPTGIPPLVFIEERALAVIILTKKKWAVLLTLRRNSHFARLI